jgi:hypothetical protein
LFPDEINQSIIIRLLFFIELLPYMLLYHFRPLQVLLDTGLVMTYESAVIPLERPQLDPIANATFTVFDPRESNRAKRNITQRLNQGDCPVIVSETIA